MNPLRDKLAPAAAVVLCGLLPSTARAQESVSYAIVIGNNAPPTPDLPILKYADDDAVRLAAFFDQFARKVELLTVLDSETLAAYPEMAARTRSPTMEELDSVLVDFANRAAEDTRLGRTVALYVTFSGHGGEQDKIPFLAMERGLLTQEVISHKILDRFSETFVHLIIDACNSEAVIGARGTPKERDGATAPAPPSIVSQLPASSLPQRYSKVGVLLAGTSEQEAHEWSKHRSGIFTYALLSGLKGTADVNRDGRIEYSEVQAFINSANAGLPKAFRPRVQAYPPSSKPHLPIVSKSQLGAGAVLSGDFSSFQHFSIQLDNGESYLDANLEDNAPPAWIILPAGANACLSSDRFKAQLQPISGHEVLVSALLPTAECESATPRGMAAEFRRSLFNTRFGRKYYQGFVDALGVPSVRFEQQPPPPPPPPPPGRSKIPSIALLAGSASALAVSVWKGISAFEAQQDYESTSFQRAASDAQRRYQDDRNTAIWTGLTGIGLGVAAWILWPAAHRNTVEAVPVTFNGAPGMVLHSSW